MPLYRQIADIFEQKILSGELKHEAALPTEQELQRLFNVSRVTVRKALEQLENRDLIEKIKGSGTYVKGNKARHNALQLKGFNEEVNSQSKKPGTKIIHFQLEQAQPTIAKHLNVETGEQIFSVLRIKTINDEPEILEQTYMPLSLFPDLSVEIMQNSKYEYIEKKKHYSILLSRQQLTPILATAVVAKHLNIEPNKPVLQVSSVGELDNGTIFEYTIQYFRGYQYSFEYVSRRGLE